MLRSDVGWLRMFAASAFLLVTVSASAQQQLPMARLASLSPPGGKLGSELEVKISGGELDGVDRLLFSHPGITATPKLEPAGDFSRQPRPVPNTFLVKIAADVPQGLHEVRAVGLYGLTNPRLFQVGGFDEISKAGGNQQRNSAQELKVGSVVSGQVDNEAVDYYKISAAAGQRLILDCFAQRIDSRMDAALVLYDSSGRELRRALGGEGRDPVLELNAAAAGDFVVGVHDFTYAGGPERFYRLAVHDGPHIDFVFPPVGQPGTTGKFTLYGRNLPGGKPVEAMQIDGSPLDQLEVDIAITGDVAAQRQQSPAELLRLFEATVATQTWQLSAPQGVSNPVAIGYATAPLVIEAEPNHDAAKPQAIAVPCEFVGQFYPRGDSDWIEFTAAAGEEFWVDVMSHRLGLPTDPVVVIQRVTKNDKGEDIVSQVSATDDVAERGDGNQPQMFSMYNRDPQVRFTASETATYRIGVRDLYGDSRGDPRMVYRLAIRKPQPDFQLLVCSGFVPSENNGQIELAGLALRRGQAAKLLVKVARRDGFDGEVSVSAEGLPPGVTCGGAVIGGKSTTAALILQAAADAPAAAATFRLFGRAKINDQEITREARHGALTWGSTNLQQEPPQARVARDLALSVTDQETVPASVQVGAAMPIETSLGATIKLPIKVARHNGFSAPIKLKAEDLPPNVQGAKDVEVSGTDGEMEIALNRNDIAPGTYTFNLVGQTKFKYSRSADRTKAAEERLVELEQIAKEFAEKAKQAAGDEAKAFEEKRKQAENLKNQIEQEVKGMKDNGKEKDMNFTLISSPVILRIAAAPITVAATSPGIKKQGEKFQIPVTIERKFGFDDVVDLTLEAPGEVAGVGVFPAKAEKGQSQATLEVTLADNTKIGAHRFTLRGRMKFNNVQVEQTLPLVVTIEPK